MADLRTFLESAYPADKQLSRFGYELAIGSDEVLDATPVSNIRQVEWYETSGGHLARIAGIFGDEWSVFVISRRDGWFADFKPTRSSCGLIHFTLEAGNGAEARVAAITLLRQMSYHDDYVVPGSWVGVD